MATVLRDQITNTLRSRILASEWPGGARLKEEVLAQEFGVSRGPIRDVMLELTKEGYLRMLPNRGVSVCVFPESPARNILLRTRRDLECLSLKIGFPHWDALRFKQLQRILGLFRVSAEQEDLAGVIEQDLAFHRLIVEAYEAEDLLIIWQPLMTTIALPYSRHVNLMECYEEHRSIASVLDQRNVKHALQLLKSHIQ